ncbi:transmembrane amino acid transporter [Xylaria sp. CBS 124048]|nr:transmembrane amino acid transporter [Xylaria sp. CBS 124048]
MMAYDIHPEQRTSEKTDLARELSGGDYHEEQFIDQEVSTDVFGHEDGHDIKYKTLSWPVVAFIMVTEIVSTGTLTLPSSLAAVGIVPGVIVILFLGAFATYTAWALIQFKLRHPEVHNMGDAGYILFGPVGREILSGGTIIFAVLGTGGQVLSGQLALTALSNDKLCTVAFAGIFAIAVTLASFPRTLDSLGFLSIVGSISIVVVVVIGMVGAGVAPIQPGEVQIAVASNFTSAFISITNPVVAYAGHFMFFILISEMKQPKDAMKAIWALQISGTILFIIFAVVSYYYIGPGVASPSLLSLSPLWSKITFGLVIPNCFISASLYSHTACKLVFVRLFRHSKHIHSHTFLGWGVWTLLIVVANGLAFVFAVGIPTFNYLVGIVAALFASWYTYGLAGAFWLHDAYHFKGGVQAWTRQPVMFALNVFTIIAGAFICVGGLYGTIASWIEATASGELPPSFQC